mgnify:CR=1 FL=1
MNLEEMKVQFDAIRKDVLASLEEVKTLKELDQIRVQQLGKKGPITEVLKNIKNLANEEKPKVGALANELRSVLEEKIASVKEVLEAKALEEAGAEVLGVVAIFSYELKKAQDAFATDNIEYHTLTNYNFLIEEAVASNYIKQEDVEKLLEWRNNL